MSHTKEYKLKFYFDVTPYSMIIDAYNSGLTRLFHDLIFLSSILEVCIITWDMNVLF